MATTEYPKIIINETDQAAIPGMKFNLTVEQYYDLLHHTHKFSDLATGDANTESIEIDDSMEDSEKIEALISIVAGLQQEISELKYSLEELTDTNTSSNSEQQNTTTTDTTQQQDSNNTTTDTTQQQDPNNNNNNNPQQEPVTNTEQQDPLNP